MIYMYYLIVQNNCQQISRYYVYLPMKTWGTKELDDVYKEKLYVTEIEF